MVLQGVNVQLTMVHPYHGLLLSNEKEKFANICNNLGGSPEIGAEWGKKKKKLISKG